MLNIDSQWLLDLHATIQLVDIGKMFVVAEFMLDIKYYEKKRSNAESEAKNIDQGVKPAPGKVPDRYFQIIPE